MTEATERAEPDPIPPVAQQTETLRDEVRRTERYLDEIKRQIAELEAPGSQGE